MIYCARLRFCGYAPDSHRKAWYLHPHRPARARIIWIQRTSTPAHVFSNPRRNCFAAEPEQYRMSNGTVRCQSSSLPLPKHRGKEKPAGTAMPAGFPLSGEILVTHGSANVRSKSQARALGKRNYSGACPALRHCCGDTGRTAREQVRHFFARLSATPVAPWAA